ncbi:hypothetical protein D9M73_152710 [compost metagenome]
MTHQHLLAFMQNLFVAAVLRPGRHGRLQHAQAGTLIFHFDQEACAQRTHAPVFGCDDEGTIILVSGLDGNLALMQDNQALLFIEADVHRRMGIEADQGAVGQAQAALLAGAGALIGEPVTD